MRLRQVLNVGDGGDDVGNSIITAGYSCKASHLIHSISPRYNANYDVASQNALNSCYRSATQVCIVHSCIVLFINSLHWYII